MKTQQRSLFDNSGTPDQIPPPWVGKLSRSTDPAPSQVAIANKAASGGVKGDEATIIEVLREARTRDLRIPGSRGSLTAKEIAKAAKWMLGDKPDNVRVSRRMAALEVSQDDKHGNIVRGPLVIATGLRRSFDNEKEQAITSYALVESCCGDPHNWQDFHLDDEHTTRECEVCGNALGTAEVRNG